MADEDPEMKREREDAIELPWRQKYAYTPVFDVPAEPWHIAALWEEAYFDTAKYVIEGVLKRDLNRNVHGVAGVFLFRHYLEIALKFIIMHARWLADHGRIAGAEEIKDVAKTHRLKTLWEMAVKDCKGKIHEETWNEWDVEFVEEMILEFDAVDSSGFRFRYHGEKFGSHDPLRDIMRMNELRIRYDVLLAQMDHVRSVLGTIDTYLYETHGQIAEWEAEMRVEMESW
jgi:hypothetical protein